ncbi:hypothetical protein RM572_10145 [Streptomyces sp. DSM 42041]|uniref:Cellulose synthase n=1 Tax=Streptomyces hazeniae TaxID=3075538 RepID=A0ABU2NQT7_9ACTN|nr:hypothetical protein [Streptomyces sp. DSM 42041]MDT0379129.1 hypothetical protein [Streptomyces sp. DSM 42041]
MLTTTVCAALSAAGLAIALLTAYRRRFAAATRIAAFALVPIGLAMAGLISLAGKVGRAVGGWATDLVLDPEVWAGFGVLALAVVLYVVARVAAGRSSGRERRPSRRERRAAARAERKGLGTASAPQASTGALGAGSGTTAGAQAAGRAAEPATASGGARGGRPAGGEDDFSDIEAILKKHGI